MSTNTAEDEEEKRRIEAENKTVYERFKGVGEQSAEELKKMVLESQINQEILTRILYKKDDLIRKLIEDIEILCEHPLETWQTNRFNELSEIEIQELLRIKQKQS